MSRRINCGGPTHGSGGSALKDRRGVILVSYNDHFMKKQKCIQLKVCRYSSRSSEARDRSKNVVDFANSNTSSIMMVMNLQKLTICIINGW